MIEGKSVCVRHWFTHILTTLRRAKSDIKIDSGHTDNRVLLRLAVSKVQTVPATTDDDQIAGEISMV